jgi:hypothetical protein
MAKDKEWEQKAVPKSHRGLFTKKAHAAGKSVAEYAKEKYHAKGKLGREARLASIFIKQGKNKKRANLLGR